MTQNRRINMIRTDFLNVQGGAGGIRRDYQKPTHPSMAVDLYLSCQ